MKLDDNYSIEYDSNSVNLKFEKTLLRTDSNGKNVNYIKTDIWYYPNLKQALKAYLNKVIESPTISEVIAKIETAEALILSKVK